MNVVNTIRMLKERSDPVDFGSFPEICFPNIMLVLECPSRNRNILHLVCLVSYYASVLLNIGMFV